MWDYSHKKHTIIMNNVNKNKSSDLKEHLVKNLQTDSWSIISCSVCSLFYCCLHILEGTCLDTSLEAGIVMHYYIQLILGKRLNIYYFVKCKNGWISLAVLKDYTHEHWSHLGFAPTQTSLWKVLKRKSFMRKCNSVGQSYSRIPKWFSLSEKRFLTWSFTTGDNRC